MKYFKKICDFNELYQKLYIEYNDEMEKAKNEVNKKRIKYIIFLLLIIPLILFSIFITKNIIPDIFVFIVILIIMLIMLIIRHFGDPYNKEHEKYNNRFKEKVIKTLVESYDKNLSYRHRIGIGNYEYIDGEFEKFNLFKSEDGISGILEQGYKINMSEVHTKIKVKRGSTIITSFHGLFAEIETDQYVPCSIKIRKNSIKIPDLNDRIEIDSCEFEKIYDIYSENKIFVMQIFTAEVLQMFVDFKELTPEVTIKNNKIYIRCETGDIFEPSLMKDVLDYETLKKYYYIIGCVLDLSEELYKILKEVNTNEI